MRTYAASTLETRVARLERANRVLLLLLVAGAVLGLAAAILPQDVVRAERYQLVDESGTVRAELSLDSGSATLQFLDEAGRVKTTLGQATFGQAGAPRRAGR